MIEYQTLTMTAAQSTLFKDFMRFNILESVKPIFINMDKWYYEFHNLTETEFLKIQEWESKNVTINT